jgi:predicted phage terminase large subunit-like protein
MNNAIADVDLSIFNEHLKYDTNKFINICCIKSFQVFVREFWETVPGAGKLIWNWHMGILCDEMQFVAEKTFRNESKSHDLIFNVPPGTSKPVWEESPILMGDGTYKKLKLIKEGDYVIGKSGKPCRVSAVHIQGNLPCVKIETFGGRRIITAKDHPILTADGWMNAENIKPEQMLALMHTPKIKGTTNRNIDEFRLAGYLIGDGSLTSGNCSLTSKDPEYIDDFTSVLDRLNFGYVVKVLSNGVTSIRLKNKYKADGTNIGKYKGQGRGCQREHNKHGPRQWTRDVGLWGKSSYTKRVPDFVWKGTDEQIKAFLVSYFHCDGCVSWKDAGKRNIVVSATSVSRMLIVGLQRLFLRLGISMRIRERIAKNGFAYNRGLKDYKYYTLETTDQDTANRFMELIPLLGPKKRKLEEFKPHRRTFEQTYLPDRVERNTELKKELPCRCLTVEGDASFVVNGVVVHNSTLLSILFLPWTWTFFPKARHLNGSHTDSLVYDLSDKCRNVLKSDKYKQMFPHVILDHDSVSYFTNTLGGDRNSCTIAGKSPTGKHAHFLIIDDPIDPKKALSQVELKTADDFMTQTLSSRKVRTDKDIAVTILIMQRLHYEDPTGLWLERCKNEEMGSVKRISLPAEITPEFKVIPDELESNYVDGLLDPVRYPKHVLKQQRASMGIYAYDGQFGQRPVPPGGSMFKIEFFNKRVKSAPYHAIRRVRFWDRACLIQGTLIQTDRGEIPIELVEIGDKVLTRQGYCEVEWSGKTKEVNQLISVMFSNGASVTGTPDHPVFTLNRGWVELGKLDASCIVIEKDAVSWDAKDQSHFQQQKQLFSTELLTQGKSENDTSKQIDISPKKGSTLQTHFIEQFGHSTTALFPMVAISITKTTTGITIQSKILNASIAKSMRLNIATRCDEMRSNLNAQWRGLKNGKRKTPNSYCSNEKSNQKPLKNSCGKTKSKKTVSIADQYLWIDQFFTRVGSALESAVPLSLTKERWPVYDLTIKDHHEFFANGILVHNSSHQSDTACYTVGVLMCLSVDGNYYVEDVVRGQWEPYERNQIILSTALKDQRKYGPKQKIEIYVEKEGGSTNKDAFQALMRMMAGFNLRERSVNDAGKKERADPWSSMLASGCVYVVETEDMTWSINDYIKEHISFPAGRLKDQVDASSGAFNILCNGRKAAGVRKFNIRDPRQNKLHIKILLCEPSDNQHIIADENSIYIYLSDPPINDEIIEIPPIGLTKICDTVNVSFADINPENYVGGWLDKIEPWGKPPSELMIAQSHGKRIWRALSARRGFTPSLIVICDYNANRALSVGLGICDVLRLRREETLLRWGDEEWKAKTGETAPNVNIYDMIKATRELILT